MRATVAFILLVLVAFQAVAAIPQTSRDLNKLSARAAEYWKFVAAGERVKASGYVVPGKRESYLNGAAPPVAEPKLLGIQFTSDPARMIVRVNVKPVPGTIDVQLAVIEQPWVWTNNNWFVDTADSPNPFQTDKRSGAMNNAALKQLEQDFRLKTTEVSVGTIWEGNYPNFPVEIEYTGKDPIRIDGDPRVPFIGIDPPVTQYIRPGTKTINVRIDSTRIDGPFSVNAKLSIITQDALIERPLHVEGTVFRPIKISQIPDPIVFAPGQNCEIKVRNDTDAPVRITEIETGGLFDVVTNPSDIQPKTEATIVLAARGNRPATEPQVNVQIAMPPHGVRLYPVKIRTKPAQ